MAIVRYRKQKTCTHRYRYRCPDTRLHRYTHTDALTHYPNWKIGQPAERAIEMAAVSL